MVGFRLLPAFVALVLCYQIAHGNETEPGQDPVNTLQTVLNKAVEEKAIPESEAEKLIKFCIDEGNLEKKALGKVLSETLDKAWRSNAAFETPYYKRLTVWASKDYPENFKRMKIISTDEVVEMLEPDDNDILELFTQNPDASADNIQELITQNTQEIKEQLESLSPKKLLAVKIIASVLRKTVGRSVTRGNAARVVKATMNMALNNGEETAMTILNDTINDAVNNNLVPSQLVYYVNRIAINEDLDKE